MHLKNITGKSATDCPELIGRLAAALSEADSVVIGAGAGLSVSAGFTYTGERFEKYFGDFARRYGITDIYSGGFYPYETLEEYWAWWSRHIYYNRYVDAPKPVYERLWQLVKDKDYFVLTTNVDHQFQKAGFDKRRLFYTQGDYGLFQCSKPCCQKTYDNEAAIRSMVEQQRGMKIPSKLIPHCPVCGAPMTVNLRIDGTFVQDEGWEEAGRRYTEFIRSHRKGKVLYLELGVGGNTPVIIKYPFWKMTAENPDAVYVCINYGEAVCPADLKGQAICINDDINRVFTQLAG